MIDKQNEKQMYKNQTELLELKTQLLRVKN